MRVLFFFVKISSLVSAMIVNFNQTKGFDPLSFTNIRSFGLSQGSFNYYICTQCKSYTQLCLWAVSVIKGWRRAKKCVTLPNVATTWKKQNIKCLRVDAGIGTKHLYLQELLLLSSANIISRCWNLEIKRRTTSDIKLNLSSLSATCGSSYIKLTIWHPVRSPKPLVGTCLWTSFCGRSTLRLSWICLLTPFSSHGLAKGLINKKRIQLSHVWEAKMGCTCGYATWD